MEFFLAIVAKWSVERIKFVGICSDEASLGQSQPFIFHLIQFIISTQNVLSLIVMLLGND